MKVVSGGGSLNPWAEPFVPSGVQYRGLQQQAEAVEDFSPEWWRLVASSPAFRDRWVRDYDALGLLDEQRDDDGDAEEVDSFLPDDLLFSPPPTRQGADQGGGRDAGKTRGAGGLEVAVWGIDKWRRAHGSPPEVPRYAEKAPRTKVAGGARVSPRPIQQPR